MKLHLWTIMGLISVGAMATAQEKPLPRLGTNLAGIADWSTQWPFVDLMKNSREWISQREGSGWGQGPALDLDEHGWVRSLEPNCYVNTPVFNIDGTGVLPGTYEVLWDGQGELAFWSGGNFPDIVLQEGNRILLDVERYDRIWLEIRETDPSDYIRNVRILSPGHESLGTFHPVFLDRLSGYDALRFMDWQATNPTSVATWADRSLPEDATYSTSAGVPYEVLIELANTTGKMPWFCVPHAADDDFVRRFARLIRDQLDPHLTFLIEYSNETWNSIFAAHAYTRDRGLELELSDNAYQASLFYHGRRAVEIFDIFEQEFGGHERFVRVLSSQWANPWTMRQVVGFENAYEHADAYAVAPYFSAGLGGEDSTADMSLEEVFAALSADLDARPAAFREHLDYLEPLGLELISYEGGQHLAGTGGRENDDRINALFDAANRDPRMGALYARYLRQWSQLGGGLFMHFSDVGRMSKWGRWGALEFQDQPRAEAPKFDALMDYANTRGDLLSERDGLLARWGWDGHRFMNYHGLGQIPEQITLIGVADFDDDTDDDLFLHDPTGQRAYVAEMEGSRLLRFFEWMALPLGAMPEAVADIDGDGDVELVTRTMAGAVSFVDRDGSERAFDTLDSRARVVGAGDLDGDLRIDLATIDADGVLEAWLLDAGTLRERVVVGSIGEGETPLGLGDADGDGHPDLWIRRGQDEAGAYLLHALTMSSYRTLGTPAANWKPIGPVEP